jgi:hypothetical protein
MMDNEIKVMERQNAHLRLVLQNLVDKLKKIDADPMLGAVFTSAYIHGVIYDGPNYSKELIAAEAALTIVKEPWDE